MYDDFVTKGLWQKTSKKIPFETHLVELENRPKYFVDHLTQRYYIIENGMRKEIDAETAKAMDKYEVWEPQFIVNQLNDYYTGQLKKFPFRNLIKSKSHFNTVVNEPIMKYGTKENDD